MIIRLADQVVNLEGDTDDMARRNRNTVNPLEQVETELDKAREEIASTVETDNWEDTRDTEEKTNEELKSEISDNGDDTGKVDDQMSCEEFNSLFQEKQRKKEERKLKKELKERLKKLEESNSKSWQFKNVFPIFRNDEIFEYHTSLNILQLGELYLSGRIYYDENSQRGLKHTKNKGDVPLINMKHTKNILNSIMSSSTVNGGCIYLNYAKENKDELEFDSVNNSLSGNAPLSIIDAAHRLESAKLWYKAYRKDPTSIKDPSKFYFHVAINNLNQKNAKNVFVELNSFGLPISKTRLAYHDVFNPSNAIAQKLMNEVFRGKIEVVSNSIKKSSNCVMTFSTLLKGCSEFSPTTKGDAERIGNYLCEFFEEIIEMFPKIYGNVSPEIRQEEKAKTFVGEVMFIHALFNLAKQLQDRDDWKERLQRLTWDDFLSRDKELWIRNITRNEGKLINTSSTQKFVTEQIVKKVMG